MKSFFKGMITGVGICTVLVTTTYGANQIIDFSSTVSSGDIITAAWFNKVNERLGGQYSEGSLCSYTNGKIECNTEKKEPLYVFRLKSKNSNNWISEWNALKNQKPYKADNPLSAHWHKKCTALEDGFLQVEKDVHAGIEDDSAIHNCFRHICIWEGRQSDRNVDVMFIEGVIGPGHGGDYKNRDFYINCGGVAMQK